jgi:PhzF family phenazine biosynthesis protein
MKIDFTQVDVFTTELFGGNPAGIVLDARKLTPSLMQKIAREINLSETAFLLPSKKADFKLRYFTPTKEVKFCGHATVGTLHALAYTGKFGMKPGKKYYFKVETSAGIIPMSANFIHADNIAISFNAPTIKLKKANFNHKKLSQALGIPENVFNKDLPIMIEETNSFIYATVENLRTLGNVNYDYDSAEKFSKEHNIVVFCLLTNQTKDKKNDVHSRVFGPLIGLVEDPVTGATQGALGAYLLQNKILPESTSTINSEQGHFVGRPGNLQIKISKNDKGKYQAKIHARAVSVFETTIKI